MYLRKRLCASLVFFLFLFLCFFVCLFFSRDRMMFVGFFVFSIVFGLKSSTNACMHAMNFKAIILPSSKMEQGILFS